jgi:hypothetical protein
MCGRRKGKLWGGCLSSITNRTQVFRIVNPHEMGYAVRWPLYGNRLNTRQYKSVPELMGDIETIWSIVLRDGLKIDRKAYKVKPEGPIRFCD